MSLQEHSEVLVAGAGPVGMTAAACMARLGLRVQIVEQGHRPAARSYALALHPGSLEIFAELGLVDALLERGNIVDTVAFYEGDRRRAELELAKSGSKFPFILVLAQSALEEVLAQFLEDQRVDILWNHRIASLEMGDDAFQAELEILNEGAGSHGVPSSPAVRHTSATTHGSFILGADGYRSAVRRALGFELEEFEAPQIFGVFEFQAAWNPAREVRVVLDRGAVSVLWPLGGQRFRWSFELSETEQSSPRLKRRLLMQMGEEAFPYIAQELLEDLVNERAPWFEAPIREVSWSVAVKFDHCMVPRLGEGCAWIVGDAAHLACPVGVHSMNMGFREARELGYLFHRVLRGAPDGDLLAEYETQWSVELRRLFGVDLGVAIEDSADDWVMANARRIPAVVPATGRHLALLLKQIGLRF